MKNVNWRVDVMKANKEKGFTLVEVLAALTILGIVFISYMTIFPQMSNMNERTETKLETMNVAKKVLTDIKNEESYALLEIDKIKTSPPSSTEYEIYKIDYPGYNVEVDCYKTKVEKKYQTCSDKNETNRLPGLYKVHIKVLKDNKLISETFGYVELK